MSSVVASCQPPCLSSSNPALCRVSRCVPPSSGFPFPPGYGLQAPRELGTSSQDSAAAPFLSP